MALRHALAIPFWVGIAGSANAGFRDAFIDPLDGSLDAGKYLSAYKLGFLPVPVVITEPKPSAAMSITPHTTSRHSTTSRWTGSFSDSECSTMVCPATMTNACRLARHRPAGDLANPLPGQRRPGSGGTAGLQDQSPLESRRVSRRRARRAVVRRARRCVFRGEQGRGVPVPDCPALWIHHGPRCCEGPEDTAFYIQAGAAW